jgi:tetratricopeptide (TPR) repeat protein
VAAGQIIDEDSELALQHAIAARRLASRIAVVREAVGLAAYAVGDWTTAIAELRTYHRMTGRQTHLAELADCERALGRPERAIDLFRGADKDTLDKAGAIELLIVAAGARGDLGQHDAAVAMLQVRELTADEDAEWAVRLRYAYADALLAAGRQDEAREWFARAAAADEDNLTDAAERLLELDGVTIEGDDPEDEPDETDTRDGEQATASRDGEPATAGAETLTAGADEEPESVTEDEDRKSRAGVADDRRRESLTVAEDEEPESLPVVAGDVDEEYSEEAFVEDDAEDADGDADGDELAEDVDAGIDAPDDEVADDEVTGDGADRVADAKVDDLDGPARGDKESRA